MAFHMRLFLLFCSLCIVPSLLVSKDQSMEKGIVVITGVTKGLGHAFAKEFKLRGWQIAGCGRSKILIQELQKEYGEEDLFSVVDVGNAQEVENWSKEIISTLGVPSIVINNAGLINDPNPLWKVSEEEFSEILKVNVNGAFNVQKSFLPSMIAQKKGLIVNISSSSGKEGEDLFGPYCASKFALEGMTQSLAKELPNGIAVVCLDPGALNTDMFQKAYPENASLYPTAEKRAKSIVSFILQMTPQDSGKSLTAASVH
jgi:NAD(P)-dependent dehydrogenase (short-subunit alcohol dehydrogenase family)